MLDSLLVVLLRPRLVALAVAAGWAGLPRPRRGRPGALVRPLLRAPCSAARRWSGRPLAPHLPPPPAVATLRVALPVLIVAVALVKGLAQHRHAVTTARLGQGVVTDLRLRLHAPGCWTCRPTP
ncbi:MAG: hypothetical protein R3F60_24565 [bacterium]